MCVDFFLVCTPFFYPVHFKMVSSFGILFCACFLLYLIKALVLSFGQNKMKMEAQLYNHEGNARDCAQLCNLWMLKCTQNKFDPTKFTVKNRYRNMFELFIQLYWEVGTGSALPAIDYVTGEPIPKHVHGNNDQAVSRNYSQEKVEELKVQIGGLEEQIETMSKNRQFADCLKAEEVLEQKKEELAKAEEDAKRFEEQKKAVHAPKSNVDPSMFSAANVSLNERGVGDGGATCALLQEMVNTQQEMLEVMKKQQNDTMMVRNLVTAMCAQLVPDMKIPDEPEESDPEQVVPPLRMQLMGELPAITGIGFQQNESGNTSGTEHTGTSTPTTGQSVVGKMDESECTETLVDEGKDS